MEVATHPPGSDEPDMTRDSTFRGELFAKISAALRLADRFALEVFQSPVGD